MLVAIGILGGIAWGAWLARKRGGSKADMAQYAAGFAIFWGVVAVIASLVLNAWS